MQKRRLGASSLEVTEIALGCMSFHALAEGQPIIEQALELGINTFDTADLYDRGENERIVGEVLKQHRQEVIIATKVGNRWWQDGSGWDWVPRKDYILAAVEESLRRLQTDYIDLYQLHGGTIDDPLEEVVEAFELLKSQGKIREYGISSIRPNTIRKWTAVASSASCMTQYSLLDRRPEEETLDHLTAQQVGVLVRGGLAKGLLLGKPARSYLGYTKEDLAERLAAFSQHFTNDQRAGAALQFTLAHPATSSVVVGARIPQQLLEVVKSYKTVAVNSTMREELKAVFPSQRYEQHR